MRLEFLLVAAAVALLAVAAPAQETVRTGKERLGSKAADQQRVDDCNVPPALRDPRRPRPSECGEQARRARERAGESREIEETARGDAN